MPFLKWTAQFRMTLRDTKALTWLACWRIRPNLDLSSGEFVSPASRGQGERELLELKLLPEAELVSLPDFQPSESGVSLAGACPRAAPLWKLSNRLARAHSLALSSDSFWLALGQLAAD